MAFIDSGKSKREVSLAAGKGPGYLHSILKEGKDPGIENLIAICEKIDVSVIYVLYGMRITPQEEQLLTAIRDNPEKRKAIFSLLLG